MTTLAEYLDWRPTDEVPQTDEERAAWSIDSTDAANWALRKLARARASIAEVERQAEVERARIDDWVAGERRRGERDVSFFEGALVAWHAERLGADPDARTIRLPAGTLSARKAPDSWKAQDEAAFLAWAEANRPALVRVKREPNIADAKRVLEARGPGVVDPQTGEIVPGLVVEVGGLTFKVSTDQ